MATPGLDPETLARLRAFAAPPPPGVPPMLARPPEFDPSLSHAPPAQGAPDWMAMAKDPTTMQPDGGDPIGQGMAMAAGAGPPGVVMAPQRAAPPTFSPPAQGGPGGLQTTSRFVQEGLKLQPGTEQAIGAAEGATADSLAAAGRSMEAQGEATTARGKALVQYDAVDQLAKRNRARIKEQAEAAEQSKLLAAKNELDNVPMQSRSQLWANRSTLDKIQSTIALSAGGFLMGFRGLKSNPAQDMIDKQLDGEIDAQKAQYDKKKTGFANATTIYGIAKKNIDDDAQAYTAAQIAAREEFIRMIDQQAADYTLEPKQKAELAALREGALAKIQDKRVQLNQLTADHVTRHEARAMAGGGMGLSNLKLDGTAVRLPDGSWAQAPTEESAKDLRNEIAAVTEARARAEDVKKAFAEGTVGDGGKYEAARLAYVKSLKKLGENSDKDFNVLEKQSGLDHHPATMWAQEKVGINPFAGVDASVASMQHGVDAKIKSLGAPMIQTGTATDPRGIPQRVGIQTGQTSDSWRGALSDKYGKPPPSYKPAGAK